MNIFAVNQMTCYNGVFAIMKTPQTNNEQFFSVPGQFVLVGFPHTGLFFFTKSVNYLRTSGRCLKDDRKKTDPIGP